MSSQTLTAVGLYSANVRLVSFQLPSSFNSEAWMNYQRKWTAPMQR